MHLNESLWAVLSYGPVHYILLGGCNCWVCGWNPCVTIQMKATEQYFPAVLFIMLYKVIVTFNFVNEILECDLTNEN